MRFSVSVSDLGIDPAKSRKITQTGLAIFARYFRQRVHQRFTSEGPGWAPKKEETAQAALRTSAIKSLAEHKLKRKLERELLRAERRLTRGKGTFASVNRRKAVLQEFKRQLAGGAVNLSKTKTLKGGALAIAAFTGGYKPSRQLQKSVLGLGERMARAEKAASSRILGRMEGSIYQKLSKNQYELGSKIPWAGVQNEGGVVGHGAKIPARPFVYLEDADVEVLMEILVNRALRAFS